MRNAGKGKAALRQSGFVRRSQMRNAGKERQSGVAERRSSVAGSHERDRRLWCVLAGTFSFEGMLMN